MDIPDKYIRLTYSYLALRKAVGWIGILLPFALMIGNFYFEGKTVRKSISHYYHSNVGDLFVGSLCALALFMFFYCGYDRKDNWAGHLAGLSALGVAFFPTTESGPREPVGYAHLVFAAILFITLTIFSLFLFTKTHEDREPTPRKLIRNKIYIVCGLIMAGCLVSIVVYFLIIGMKESDSSFVYWAETVALIAFGVSWLTKGETLFPDQADGEL